MIPLCQRRAAAAFARTFGNRALFRSLLAGWCHRRGIPPPPEVAELPPAPIAAEPDDFGTLYEFIRGTERRALGTYFTPPETVEFVLRETLDPLIAGSAGDADALLALRIVDPAAGSGNFLIAAAARLLESVRRLRFGAAMRDLLPALHGVEIDPGAADIARLRMWSAAALPGEPLEGFWPGLRIADALLPSTFADAAPVDVLVANPPYVSYFSRESAGDTPLEATYRQAAIARAGTDFLPGRFNLLMGFFALPPALLAPNGRAGFVLPDTVLTNGTYERFRRWTLSAEGPRLQSVSRFRDHLFLGAAIPCAVAVFSRGTSPTVAYREAPTPGSPAQAVDLSVAELLSRPLCLIGPAANALPAAYEAHLLLGDIAELRDGINPGPAAVRQRIIGREPRGENPRPLLAGEDIRPFAIEWGGLWVDAAPHALSREERRLGASLRRPEVFRPGRIVYRQTADRPIAAIDREGRMATNSVHNILLHDTRPAAAAMLVAYLNTPSCAARVAELGGETRRTFPQMHIATMRRLPVPRLVADPSRAPDLCHRAETAHSAADLQALSDAIEALLSG